MDPGDSMLEHFRLLILPTHRLIGGMDGFDMQIFTATVKEHFESLGLKYTEIGRAHV